MVVSQKGHTHLFRRQVTSSLSSLAMPPKDFCPCWPDEPVGLHQVVLLREHVQLLGPALCCPRVAPASLQVLHPDTHTKQKDN